MNDTMAVIYIAQTGHVIGAITCNSDPKRAFTPADLAGSDAAGPGFLLTAPRQLQPGPPVDPLEEFSVPVGTSANPVLSVSPPLPFREAVFQEPQGAFSVSDGVIGSNGTPFPSGWTVKLRQTTLGIDFPAGAISADTPVWAQIQDPHPTSSTPETLVLTGTIPQGSSSVQLPLTILPMGAAASVVKGKSYSVALMVGGYRPDFHRWTATA